MCRRCQAPDNRYFVKDRRTGRLVCEECGFSVTSRSPAGYRNGDYIWNLNPAWPEFHSFDQLIRSIRFGSEFHLPPCKPLVQIPSQLLTLAFDLQFQNESGQQEKE
ncbi:MAG: hypothetical protein LJE65_07295 [Desulfobacteraceae bacterium]|jgi:hypothetical protein|nr:hypothetical protein [Desulfobacteraceae bacterium]